MDKLGKALAKLTEKEKVLVRSILLQLMKADFSGLNAQKLSGHKEIFRVRKGRLRIIYKHAKSDITILVIERRSEKTYRNF